MRARTGIKRIGIIVAMGVAVSGLSGCAEMSGAQKGAAIGGGTGALAGAIIGNQVGGNRPGHAGTGAIIGALGGAAVGALAGDQYDRNQRASQPAPPPSPAAAYPPVAPPAGAYPPPPPPPPPQSQASVTLPGQHAGDPTRGEIVNTTPYRVRLYLDTDPARQPGAQAYTLNPSQVLPANLDVGNHRVVAVATRDTQFGPREVGRLDRSLPINVRGSGWELRLNEGDFR